MNKQVWSEVINIAGVIEEGTRAEEEVEYVIIKAETASKDRT